EPTFALQSLIDIASEYRDLPFPLFSCHGLPLFKYHNRLKLCIESVSANSTRRRWGSRSWCHWCSVCPLCAWLLRIISGVLIRHKLLLSWFPFLSMGSERLQCRMRVRGST